MRGISTIEWRRGLAGAMVLLGALCVALAMSAAAKAAEPKFEDTFTCDVATPCGSLEENFIPGRLAVNEVTGDVYVIDTGTEEVSEEVENPETEEMEIITKTVPHDLIIAFDANGVYKSTIDGKDMPGGSFGFDPSYGTTDIAVDNSGGANQGDVYVASGITGTGYFGFNDDGSSPWKVENGGACGVAVNDDGELYGAEYGGGVQQRNPADEGSPIGSPIAAGADSCSIAFDSEDNLYMRHFDTNGVEKLLAPGYTIPGTLLADSGLVDVEVSAIDYAYAAGSTVFRIFQPDGSPSLDAGPVGLGIDSGVFGRGYIGAVPNAENGRIYVTDANNKQIELWQYQDLPLTVNEPGTGTGKVECEVNGGPAEACAAKYLDGTTVTLTATPDPGSNLTSFSGGGCASSPCTLMLKEDTTITATFDLPEHDLAIAKAGSGAATSSVTCKVGANPAGACAAEYIEGTTVTVAAVPGANVKFDGFSGDCTGATCEVTMSADKAITATFTLMRKLNISKTGNGAASSSLTCEVSPDPAGPCATEYPSGTVVKVAAAPGAKIQFNGFTGGGCTTSPCSVTMSADKTIVASFTIITHTLAVNKAGSGSGSVSCNGGACASSYEEGTTITLAASAAAGSTFAGFSGGGCSGTGPCAVTLNADTTVTATFNANPTNGGGGGGGGNNPTPPPPPPPPNNAYAECVTKANKAFKAAKKAAAKKKGKAKAKAMKAANKRKAKAMKACKALL